MKELPARGWGAARMAIALAFLFCARAQAHVYVITDTNDTTSVTSLRGAIIEANASGGENTIILGEESDPRRREEPKAWTFYLTVTGQGEVAAQTGDLDITAGKLTIVGATTNVTINATALGDRVFHVWPGARLELEDLIITGGGSLFPQQVAPPIGIIISGPPTGPEPPEPIEPIVPILPVTPLQPLPPPIVITQPILPTNIFEPTPLPVVPPITNVFEPVPIPVLPITPVVPITEPTEPSGGIGIVGLQAQKAVQRVTVAASSVTPEGGGGILNDGTLILRNCVVESNSVFAAGAGGGIFNTGEMKLINCCITGNIAYQENGGGIYNSGSLNMERCVVSNNSAGLGGNGGGIYNDVSGMAVLHESAISSNSCGPGVVDVVEGNYVSIPGGSGGGLYNAGELTLKNCLVSGNACGGGGSAGIGGSGGGIYSFSNLTVITCTISGNSAGAGGVVALPFSGPLAGNGGAGGNGGGIYSSGGFLLESSTIASNSAGAGGTGGLTVNGGAGGSGGGVYDAADGSSASIENTLIALNMAGAGGPGGLAGISPDVFGPFVSHGFNLVGEADGSTGFTSGVHADQVGTMVAPINPLLGPLQMNGGPTATHALLTGSPAIDKGDSFGIHRDQRGAYRPYNYLGIPNAAGGDGSDIGAFELQPGERFEPCREDFERR